MIKKEHSGQVALVLILIMTVVSALAVSLASRSTVDTRIQQTESESIQALLFAQTGVEQLIMNPQENEAVDPDGNYSAIKSDAGIEDLAVESIGPGATLELSLIPASASLTGFVVNWGPDNANPSGTPAIFISVHENSGIITDYAYGYVSDNNFTLGLAGSAGYAKKTSSIPLSIGVEKVRVTVLGSSAKLLFTPEGAGAVFPPQIKSIKSTGSVLSGENSVKYGLQYDESASDLIPSVFDYALFSGGSIIQ